MSQRVLIGGGYILTMDTGIGDLLPADVLVEDGRIVAVERSIDAEDCEVVDASSSIVIPGFVDTHRHTWETVLRGVAPDMSLGDYLPVVLGVFAPAYRAEDVYAANYLGSLEAIDAGITTLLDWSHINNTPEHSDAGIRGLQNAALRAVYCYGCPNTSLADWWLESNLKSPVDIHRVRDQYFASDTGLITLAMGTRGPGFTTPEVVRHDWQLARDVGAPISVHVGMGPVAGRLSMVKRLHELGLLGDDTTYVHCNYLSDEELDLIAATGGRATVSPSVELVMGHGIPPTGRLLERGIRPGLGVDAVTTVPGDMFTQMRFAHAVQRGMAQDASFRANLDDCGPLVTAREVLEFATIEGARVCGLADRTGSLTPGKQADLVLLKFDYTNTWPLIDPASTVVLQADTKNVDMVMVGGRFLKREGALVGVDLRRARDDAAASLDYLIEFAEAQPHWVQTHATASANDHVDAR
jgi:cytosine/adenosine deaminase-related metal-dependent hydrolase